MTNPSPALENIFEGLMPDCPLMAPAWIGSMSFALGKDDIMQQFRKDTGNNWQPRGGIEGMVDKACGVDKEFFQQFAKWHNDNIWGEV